MIANAESPSSRRAWIEISQRMRSSMSANVALLAEGVDRNSALGICIKNESESPSSRRAWIEIGGHHGCCVSLLVALLAEGVDRNGLRGGNIRPVDKSPSSRRAWIEILDGLNVLAERTGRPPRGGRG